MAKKAPPRKKSAAPPRARRGQGAPRRAPDHAKPAQSGVSLRAGESARSALVIAGVGASAGGLEAFSQLLQALPEDPGVAVVLVQHLAPQHESALPVLLSGRTHLQVVQATEGMRVERNHVYVIPPNVQMSIHNDVLHLLARPSDRTQYMPIDYFLHSLAESAQDRAIGIILSGTASDGTAGAREIKAVGGITIAQNPETAKYDGMPRTAIASGFIDLVLSPAEIAAELVSIARHPLRQTHAIIAAAPALEQQTPTAPGDQAMDQIFGLLRSSSGVDFRRYKRATIERRLQRRMVLHKFTRLELYIRYLRENPAEVQALYDDILIHVTRFFRDPDMFNALTEQVLPKIVANGSDEQPIRIWVPGCSTGEEAYSVTIVLLEFLGEHGHAGPVQVFATDIGDASIAKARSGSYPESIAADIMPERLRRFFSKVDGGYRINKAVRDVCIFARQDLTHDPPFSKVDLILCRNVLIYLGTDLQKKLMGVFYYALRPTGFLVLGNAETIGASALYTAVDRKHRIYQKKAGTPHAHEIDLRMDYGPGRQVHAGKLGAVRHSEAKTVENEATRLIQDRFAPPGVIVDNNFTVVQFRGQTGGFLEPAPGEPSTNLLKMARDGLLHGLRMALQQARKTAAPVRKRGLRVRSNGGWRDLNLEVLPLVAADRVHFLVLFDEVTGGGAPKARERAGGRPSSDDVVTRGGRRNARHTARLQQELASSREYLQSIIQDLEAANEELQSANEEVLSANEELQSTNEELDTAKEELQSTNEELNTVNEELHGRNDELSRVNSDLVNLLSSVQIAIVIVASDLRIRRFTPMAERVLNLISSDVGRPISHVKPNIDCPDLEELISQVIDTVTPCEREVRDQEGKQLSLRIRPYKNLENRIDGAVLALFETDGVRRQPPSDEYLKGVIDSVDQPMLLLGEQQRIRACNRAFAHSFGVRPADVIDEVIYNLDGGKWNTTRLHALLESELPTNPVVDGVEIDHDFSEADRRRIVITGRRLGTAGARGAMVVLAFRETSGDVNKR
jgi:two-component system CheB/CheR fusion protein